MDIKIYKGIFNRDEMVALVVPMQENSIPGKFKPFDIRGDDMGDLAAGG